jgi:hypothetical protein
MKVLIISPQAGMGNRFQSTCSALVLGDLLGRKVYHAWIPEVPERQSHLSNVKAMQSVSFGDLFEGDLIPQWDQSQPINTCFSEWLPGQFWYITQSSAYQQLGAKSIRHIGTDASPLEACTDDVILLETSHIVQLPLHQSSWESKMSQYYQLYFKPAPKYKELMTIQADIGVSVRRGDLLVHYPEARQDVDEICTWLREKSNDRSVIIFSDDHSARDKIRQKVGSNLALVDTDLLDWERGFVEFLTLALRCKQLYGTPLSSFAKQASVFGNVPYTELLEPSQRRVLVLYAYSESERGHEVLSYFVKNGMLETKNVKYWLIINGDDKLSPSENSAWDCVIHRPNAGLDIDRL